MEPPSYEEARLNPPALGPAAYNLLPPPSYAASFYSPTIPPPTYGEAVTIQQDPFPVLNVPTAATQNHGTTIHPITLIGVTSSVGSRQTHPSVVTTQPQPVPFSVTHLGDAPGLVRCPYCHHVVTTKVTHQPGKAAWCMCVLLTMMGLICGCCFIPFMIPSLQDAHHSCPQCKNHLRVYTR
ncbi:lipopolysaccharide-induced tumor necrosis factor-alpha factor homolog [Anoplopoma fimbria]|uniref:lipopolysaccharide-induced tumor necrosis factor-alpha factor homolog n=1 Tax=Anoplopoma fimbria TaxID=229290 RepID=UPI0023EC94E7|nr:lipopolysaccharide-induced tumor necrosis factor-alpha factor homolog [Anoplopoma fimbria]